MKKKNKLISSEELKYRELRIVELVAFLFIIIGGIIASVGQIYRFRSEEMYKIFVIMIVIATILIIGSLAVFLWAYFKIKKLKE